MRSRVYRSISTIGVIVLITAFATVLPFKRTAVRAHATPVGSAAVLELPAEQSLIVGSVPTPLAKIVPPTGGGTRYRERREQKYDTRAFEQMADAWEKETEDPDWSLNIKTFIGAMTETLGGPDGDLAGLSVRCKQSICRIDAEESNPVILARLLDASRSQKPHVTYQLEPSDAGSHLEAYLGRERDAVGNDEDL